MSCGASPTEQKGKNWLCAPILLGPSITTCEMSRHASPNSTFAPILQYGPIAQVGCTFAPGSTMAVAWTLAGLLIARVVDRLMRFGARRVQDPSVPVELPEMSASEGPRERWMSWQVTV